MTTTLTAADSVDRPRAIALLDSGGTVASDVTLTRTARCIWVGTSGDVTITTAGADITLKAVTAGMWHPMPDFTAVKATGTTAQDVIVGY